MIVEIDNIELDFDNKKILHGVYLKAETGTVTGILGRNGSGKTSLLRILFGSLNSKYKNIRINNAHQKKELYKSNTIAYLPQHQLLPNSMKLKNAFKLFEVKWDDFILLFDSFKKHYTSSSILSISLDEPFSFIAPIYIENFKQLIEEKKLESAIIITDHFYSDILDISKNVYFIKNGSSKLIASKQDLENEGYINLNEQR